MQDTVDHVHTCPGAAQDDVDHTRPGAAQNDVDHSYPVASRRYCVLPDAAQAAVGQHFQ